MTSTRPYLLRALYDWIVDNDLTPFILVDATAPDVEVPRQFVEDDKIVLNITPGAIRDLDIGNDFLSFSARFSGHPQYILTPISAIQAIYAKENGKGMLFPEDEDETEIDGPMQSHEQVVEAKKPHLKIVK
jgi:stringent starvation protein B